jgi:hypothetical protein
MNDYIWTPSGTDITERWRRIGWTPPSECPAYQQKWSEYKAMPLRTLTDEQRQSIKQIMTDNVITYQRGRK